MKRLHDLDALRACAMLLGVLLHAVFCTIPFRYFRHHVLPGASNSWALPYFHLVQLVHGFRMPVFFLLSGFFCALLWQRRGLRGLLKNRILRIALPLLICIPTVRSMEYILNLLDWGYDATSAEWAAAMVRDLSNLWFLWQLLLLSALLLVAARLGLRFRHPLWWLLIPASWLPMFLMDQTFLVFGPQTSVAVAVEAPVPGFYATFFFFGVFFYQRGFAAAGEPAGDRLRLAHVLRHDGPLPRHRPARAPLGASPRGLCLLDLPDARVADAGARRPAALAGAQPAFVLPAAGADRNRHSARCLDPRGSLLLDRHVVERQT